MCLLECGAEIRLFFRFYQRHYTWWMFAHFYRCRGWVYRTQQRIFDRTWQAFRHLTSDTINHLSKNMNGKCTLYGMLRQGTSKSCVPEGTAGLEHVTICYLSFENVVLAFLKVEDHKYQIYWKTACKAKNCGGLWWIGRRVYVLGNLKLLL